MKMPPLIRRGFNLGVKSSIDPSAVPPNALYRGLNVTCDESGIIRIREGCETYGPSLGAGAYQGEASAFGRLLAVWRKGVYLVEDGGSPSQIGSSLVTAGDEDSVSIINWTKNGAEIAYLYGGNGIYQTDGTTSGAITPYKPLAGESANLIKNFDDSLNLDSGPCRCKYAVLKASLSQRVAVAGDYKSPNTVYLSAPLDATYYPLDQMIQLPDDGSKITGLLNWYNALIIFRDRDIWAFFGTAVDASASLVLQDSSVGCPVGKTIATVPGVGAVFCGPDNVYAMTGVTGVENQVKCTPIGDDIAKYLKKAVSAGWKGASAVYHDRQYRLSFPWSNEDYRMFRFSIANGNPAWYADSGPAVCGFIRHEERLYGSYYNEGRAVLFSAAALTDEDQPIPVKVGFRREDLQPGPSRLKKVYIFALSRGRVQETDLFFMGSRFGESGFNDEDIDPVTISTGTKQTLEVSVVCDGIVYRVESFSVSVETVNFSDLAKIEPVRVYEARFSPSLKGNFAQIEIAGTVPGEDIAILGYGIEYSNRARIHGNRTKR